ncbi:MAG: nitroreductase family protein [Paludibacteraceae bacterium]|nr:nitroreductase family protein [Paludibacteraceae bacterium]
MNSLNELLKNRRSYRVFTQEPVSDADLQLIRQAALMAPAGKRMNEWEFITVTDRNTLQALSRSKENGAELLAEAPLAIVVLGDTSVCDTVVEDCSIAAILMQLQAADLSLGSCWVQCRGRYDKDGNACEDNVRRILNIPPHYLVECIIAIGHKGQERKPYDVDRLNYDKFHSELF